ASAAALALIAAVAIWAPWRSQTTPQSIRFEIAATPAVAFLTGAFPMVSPNGKWVVLPGRRSAGVTRMWLRALDSVDIRPLEGTESPNAAPPPVVWSPDSR